MLGFTNLHSAFISYHSWLDVVQCFTACLVCIKAWFSISTTKIIRIYLFQLNVHIVFEGEKEFHQNVKLWGVSIMNPLIFFPDNEKNKFRMNTHGKLINITLMCLSRYLNCIKNGSRGLIFNIRISKMCFSKTNKSTKLLFTLDVL